MKERCDMDSLFIGDQLEHCDQQPTNRYRSAGMAEGHWSYRCAKHVKWLDKNHCTIEPIRRF